MEAIEREISTPPEADDYAGRVKLTAYMAEKRLTVRCIAETLKGSGWPRCSGAAISMAARPSETAVQLVAQAFPVLYENFGAPSQKLMKRSRVENRAKPFRVSVRFTESEYRAFNAARGGISAQEFAHSLIVGALKGAENA